MFRAFLILATVSIAALIGWQTGLLDGDSRGGKLVSTTSDDSLGPLNRPSIKILSAPATLVLRESGAVRVQATAPAIPGDRVVLRTAGTYGAGYNKVSQAILDDKLQAVLEITGRRFLGAYDYWATVRATARFQEGKSATFAINIVAAEAQAGPSCGGADPRKSDGTSWACTFHDEFDGPYLDRRYWVPQNTATSGFTTGTKYRYACAEDTPETVNVVGGNLELSLVNHPQGQKCGSKKFSKYGFGQVMHFQTFSQTYGKYEIRAKIPDLTIPGSQQSFWLWPVKNTYGGWPASGEIDFAEMYSSAPGISKPYIHYLPGQGASGTNENRTHAVCPIRVGEFNTYGVEWKPKQITVYVNGEVCFVNDYRSVTANIQGETAPFDKPFYLSLNQAMGTTGNEYDPAVFPVRVTTQVDYVRIWK